MGGITAHNVHMLNPPYHGPEQYSGFLLIHLYMKQTEVNVRSQLPKKNNLETEHKKMICITKFTENGFGLVAADDKTRLIQAKITASVT